MLAVLRASLEQQLLDVQAQMAALNAEIVSSSSHPGISSMELDTGEARQKVVLKSVESLYRTLRRLRATEAWLIRRLNGGGIVSVRNRRKS
jgi:hypothetical protein